MRLNIYTIYDIKAEAYLTPFFSPNKGLALRMFMQAGAEPTSNVHQFPADFTLFELGSFEQDTAKFEIHNAVINMGTALQHLSSMASNLAAGAAGTATQKEERTS